VHSGLVIPVICGADFRCSGFHYVAADRAIEVYSRAGYAGLLSVWVVIILTKPILLPSSLMSHEVGISQLSAVEANREMGRASQKLWAEPSTKFRAS